MTIWETFENIFLRKFGKKKTPATCVLELSRIKMDTEELVIDYNQRFLTKLKRIPHTSKTAEDVTIEFYTSGLPISMAMHVNNAEKHTLKEAFQ